MSLEITPAARNRKRDYWSSAAGFLATLLVVALMSLVPFAIRAFLFQAFSAASLSMAPTLVVGDYFFVSKYDFSLSPSKPEPGDVVVFQSPGDPAIDYVKRIVGMPGDRIQMIDGLLHINGQPVRQQMLTPFVDGGRMNIRRWRETLPNGVSYETLDLRSNGLLDNTSAFQVPPGHVFVLGDNRDNSMDSRVAVNRSGGIGYVPIENITGRARIIYFSSHLSRIGKLIR